MIDPTVVVAQIDFPSGIKFGAVQLPRLKRDDITILPKALAEQMQSEGSVKVVVVK